MFHKTNYRQQLALKHYKLHYFKTQWPVSYDIENIALRKITRFCKTCKPFLVEGAYLTSVPSRDMMYGNNKIEM